MENKYQNLMRNIPVPARLTDQVLAAARMEMAGEAGPGHPARKTSRPVLRAALCAVIALVLIVGLVPFHTAKPESGADSSGGLSSAGLAAAKLSFGLTAYAAGVDERYPAGADGSLAMGSGGGMYWQEQNSFLTGSLFQVTGENVQTVSLSLDRGGIYSYRILNDLTPEQMQEIREAQERGEMAPTSIDQDFNGDWSCQEIIPLGDTVTADYDADAWYGLWIPDEYIENNENDLRTGYESNVDALDGGLLTVTVTFDGGMEQTNSYRLHTGKLRVSGNEEGTALPLPELAGEGDPYIYGVYAVLEQ